jgi:hypothetical protein
VSARLILDLPESSYHADDFGEGLRLNVTTAQALVLESEAHAYLRHPKLGGQPFTPTKEMDRGTLVHALLLGKGREVAVVECDAWTKKKDKELRDFHRAAGRTAVTQKLYDECLEAGEAIEKKLKARGFILDGASEATLLWEETAKNGNVVQCRARMDHVNPDLGKIFELKITGDANPKTVTRGHITRMGYDIQGAAYPRGLARAKPELMGRIEYTMLFCEATPPHCVTAVRFAGSLRELGERKWQRGVNRWERCVRMGEWRDYSDEVVFAEARGWELDEEDESAA